MATATLVRDSLKGFKGHASLYRCDPPHDGHEFVIASTSSYLGLETYLFPANDGGEVQDWLEMEGSMKGTSSHDEAWANAGYDVSR